MRNDLLDLNWMKGVLLRCVALLSVSAVLASAHCAALCVLPSFGESHQQHSRPTSGHHASSCHENGDDQSSPAPDQHNSDSSCPDHSAYLFGAQKSNIDFSPAFTKVLYALPGTGAAWVPDLAFSVYSFMMHPPPGGSGPRTLTTVLRI